MEPMLEAISPTIWATPPFTSILVYLSVTIPLSVRYFGDSVHNAVTSDPVGFDIINAAVSPITLTPSPISQGVVADAYISCDSTCGTGGSTWTIDGNYCGGGGFVPNEVADIQIGPNGCGTAANAPLTVGPHTLQVTYGGDATHPPVTSEVLNFNVITNILQVPPVTVSAVPNAIPYGEFALATITVGCSSACGKGYWFVDGDYAGPFILDDTGTAIVQTSTNLQIGPHQITVDYFGNAAYSNVTNSAPYDFSVVSSSSLPQPTINITLGTTSISAGTPLPFSLSFNCGLSLRSKLRH